MSGCQMGETSAKYDYNGNLEDKIQIDVAFVFLLLVIVGVVAFRIPFFWYLDSTEYRELQMEYRYAIYESEKGGLSILNGFDRFSIGCVHLSMISDPPLERFYSYLTGYCCWH